MGRKINPIGFRLAVTRDWSSLWYARKRDFADCLVEDYHVRKYIKDNHAAAMISRIDIKRMDSMSGPIVYIHVARPGVLIGTKGEDIGKLREQVRKITGKQDTVVEVREVRDADADASLVAQGIAGRLEKRQRSRRVIQSTLQAVSRQPSVLGVKIRVKGRLEGADIARVDYRHEGQVPLHTLRAIIDYGFAEATTQMGQLGIKVWIYRGQRDKGEIGRAEFGLGGSTPAEETEKDPSVTASGLDALLAEPQVKSAPMQASSVNDDGLENLAEEYEEEHGSE